MRYWRDSRSGQPLKRRRIGRPGSFWVVGIFAVIVLGGCTHQDPESVGSFLDGVRASHHQFSVTVDSVNQLILENEIDRIVTLPSLDEDQLAIVFSPEDVNRWDQTFETLAAYAESLQRLTSPEHAREFRDSAVAVGESMKAVHPDMVPKPEIATGFAAVGKALIQRRAERSARRIMQSTDPAIQDVLSEMADTIGATRDEGIRGTAISNWTALIDSPEGPVLAFLSETGPEGKRKQALRYLELRRQRDAQDLALVQLRQSFQSLAAAHRELAAGSRSGAVASMELVIENLKDAQKLYAELKGTE